jgi:uncharacterized membrane protein YbhN (UPF0104 family)
MGLGRFAPVAARLTVSALLIAILIMNADREQIYDRLQQINLATYAIAVTLLSLLSVPHLVRWRLVLRELGVKMSSARALGIIYVGYFFNQVLPSTVGGDLARVWYVRQSGASLTTGLAAVLIDRIAGVIGLLVIGVTLISQYVDMFGPSIGYGVGAASAASLVAALVGVYAAERLGRLIPMAPVKVLAAMSKDLRQVLVSIRCGIPAVLLSLTIQFGAGATAYFIAMAANVDMTLMHGLLVFPLVTLVSIVPISIAGWGIREGAAVVLLGLVGMAKEDALVVSVLYGLAMVLISLPGGVVWVFVRRHQRDSPLE